MKEILTEFDALQEAMKKIDLDEVAMPIHNGRIVENRESYCKMQQILNAPEMIKSHAFILNLDPEQLEEDEIERVDKLWNLGVDRGFITPDKDGENDTEIAAVDAKPEVPVNEPAKQSSFSYASQKVNVPCWTVLYSATDKNGDIKTGECYSSSVNTRSAKADCYAKLERCGYSNISILAIEAGDPDNCDCCGGDGSSKQLLAEMPPKDCGETPNGKMIPDDEFMNAANESEDVEEADTSFDEPKSAHASSTQEKVVYTKDGDLDVEVAGPTDDEKAEEGADYKSLYREFLTAADDYQQIADLQGENSTAAKNAFREVQAAYEDCYAAVPTNADERELLSDVNSYGFKLAADNCTILEAEEELVDESGNPYLAGMKTADLNGQMKVSTGKKAPSKKKLDEEDDDSDKSEDDESQDDAGDESDDSSDSGEETADDDSDDAAGDKASDDSEESEDTEENSEESDDSDDAEEAEGDDSEDNSDNSDDSDEDADNDNEDSEDEYSDEEDEDVDNDNEDSEDEDSDEEDEDADTQSKDLSDEDKVQYKSDYKKAFKDVMLKCDFEDKCFDDLSIAEKVKFFTKLQKAWKKNEPKDFMSDKEIEQLNKVVVKK